MPKLRIVWGDGFIRVTPSIPPELTKALRYWHREFVQDPQTYKMVMQGHYRDCYQIGVESDPTTNLTAEYLTTLSGFMHKIKRTLQEHGIEFEVVDERMPFPEPDITAALNGLRDYQMECSYTALMSGGGIIACPTGWGKTHVIASLLRAYKQEDLCARNTPLSVITTASKDIAEQNYNSLKLVMPNREVGLIMSGRRERSDDIQVITLDSLHHIKPDDIGIMIVDEVHEAATAARSELIQGARFARRWGASATPSGRYDGSDLVTEGLVGPVVYKRAYQQGVLDGALVPIVVYWVEVPHPHIGLTKWLKYKQHKARYDWGVDKNESQNNLISALMKQIPDALQTLCIMRHTAQMNLLAPALPGVQYVHAKTDAKALQTQRQYDLVPISPAQRKELYTTFKAGTLRKIMSTYVYKQGVDFPELEIMINAGGGGSEIVSGQIPGRGSRPSLDKDKAYMIDFWHPWDTEERNGKMVPGTIFGDDTGRDKVYAKLGFERHWVKDITQLPFIPVKV